MSEAQNKGATDIALADGLQAQLVRKNEEREDVLLSDFRCKHVIGTGGFGKVYLARLQGSD